MKCSGTPQALSLLLLFGPQSFIPLEARGQASAPAIIRGRVISRAETPIAQAEVTAIGTATTVLTDTAGNFVLRGIAPGLAVLRVRRIGFKGQYLQVTVGPGESLGAEIMLDRGPQILPSISVTAKEAKPLEFAWTTKYDDFFRRRWLGMPGGTFISGEDIKRRTVIHTAELLEQYVPGARVLVHFPGPGGTEIQFPRCSRAVGYVGVWVDGKRLTRDLGYQEAFGLSFLRSPGEQARSGDRAQIRQKIAELGDALDLISPNEIQFMEVYRGIGSIPGEFSGGCGAILIWTK